AATTAKARRSAGRTGSRPSTASSATPISIERRGVRVRSRRHRHRLARNSSMPRLRPGPAPFLMLAALLAGFDASPGACRAQDLPDAAKPRAKATAPRRLGGPRTYMGRPIADVMTFHGADWLVRPEREQEEQPEAMLDALKIAAGSTVADVGAGVGYTSLKLARRVGTKGAVYATDLQPEMLRMLVANAREARGKNI